MRKSFFSMRKHAHEKQTKPPYWAMYNLGARLAFQCGEYAREKALFLKCNAQLLRKAKFAVRQPCSTTYFPENAMRKLCSWPFFKKVMLSGGFSIH